MRYIKFLPCLLMFFSVHTLAGTADPTGVAGLVFIAIIVVPLVVLVVLGYLVARWGGVVIGIIIYVAGMHFSLRDAQQRNEVRSAEIRNAGAAFTKACMNEAGETGQPLPSGHKNLFVYIDPAINDSGRGFDFEKALSSNSVEYVRTTLSVIPEGDFLVSISRISRAINDSGGRKLLGFETTVFDSDRKIIARRVNFYERRKLCLDGNEGDAIERFLQRIIGQSPLSISAIGDLPKGPVRIFKNTNFIVWS